MIENGNEVLTPQEKSTFEQAEHVIAAGLQSYFEVGRALRSINDALLYRETFRTFEDYVKVRWELSNSRAYEYIAAANIVDNLAPVSPVLPANEHQASQLKNLAPEQQQQAWLKALENAGERKLTAKIVEQAVNELLANCAGADNEDEKSGGTTLLTGELLNQYSVGDYLKYSPQFPEASIRLVLLTELLGGGRDAQSEWLTDLLKETDSALAADCNILVFADDVDYRYIVETTEARGFEFVGAATWIHDGRKSKSDYSFVRARTEILHFRRGKAKLYIPIEDCINCDIEPTKKHSNQIPLELAKSLIEAATLPHDLVLDPACRVATSNLAARELQRACIGIDPRNDSYELGLARLNQETEDVIRHEEGGVE